MRPRLSLLGGFVAAILAGAFLLALPASSPCHEWMPLPDALFTACSGVCVTGLTVIEPWRDLSFFGQIVLLVLVEIGCAGIMTLGTFLLVLTGRRLSLSSEFSMMNAYGTEGVRGLRGLAVWVVLAMLAVEALGAVGLWSEFTADAPDVRTALRDGGAWWRAVWYSVMGFCNAGFSLDSGSLSVFAHRPGVLAILSAEVVLGGFGFLVLYNLCTIKFWRRNLIRRGRISLHTRVVLFMSLWLSLAAFVAFLAVEWNGALAGCADAAERAAVAFFHAVTPRTCGFTVVPLAEMRPATRFIDGILMLIGAAPGGAGGGIKVTTFLVFICAVAAMCRGRRDVCIFKRTIAEDAVRESLVIFFLSIALACLAMTALLFTESRAGAPDFERLLFETVSAVTTTGLTIGDTTARLSQAGRCVILVCMFAGRLGALTLVLLIAGRDDPQTIRYPREELVVG